MVKASCKQTYRVPHAVISTIIYIQIVPSYRIARVTPVSLGWDLAKSLFTMGGGSIILALNYETYLIIPRASIHSDAESKC